MRSNLLSRRGKALAQLLIVFPFCLSVVAMAAISPAIIDPQALSRRTRECSIEVLAASGHD